ncbi:MAG: 30S ribosomal protein S6 [Planctomycetota bacterium]
MNTYEGMFLIDNDVVRSGWDRAKASVVGLIEKHGGSLVTARRWDERRLAYTIKKKNRATYLLSFFKLPHDAHAALNRDLEIQEFCLRHLILRHEGEVPEVELKASEIENEGTFEVPEPPDDAYDEADEPRESSDDDDDGSDDFGDDEPRNDGFKSGRPLPGAVRKPAEPKQPTETATTTEA